MSKKPLLFVSDSISGSSGLGRITRDLATRVHEHLGDVYRVGTVGYGGFGSRKFPWTDYHLHSIENWLIPELPAIADDFAGDDELTIMFIWDASRLYWIGNPSRCPNPALRRWVEEAQKTKKIRFFIYGAIDAEGPFGKLPALIAETYAGFDRIIDYSKFSSEITGHPTWIPHGIDTNVFKPQSMHEARAVVAKGGFIGLSDKSLLIGIVATNQARKNWQLGFAMARVLLDRGHDVRLWCHTDVIDRYWSLSNLIVDYGLMGRVAVTTQRFTDENLAGMYAACNITLGIGPEGWGYPICESLACGVPCVTGNYAAQADYVPERMLVNPIAFHYEGAFCSKRPVFNAEDWADRVEAMELESKQTARNSLLPEWIDWNNLWPRWEEWFRQGI